MDVCKSCSNAPFSNGYALMTCKPPELKGMNSGRWTNIGILRIGNHCFGIDFPGRLILCN
jgi:hypothetical protein